MGSVQSHERDFLGGQPAHLYSAKYSSGPVVARCSERLLRSRPLGSFSNSSMGGLHIWICLVCILSCLHRKNYTGLPSCTEGPLYATRISATCCHCSPKLQNASMRVLVREVVLEASTEKCLLLCCGRHLPLPVCTNVSPLLRLERAKWIPETLPAVTGWSSQVCRWTRFSPSTAVDC